METTQALSVSLRKLWWALRGWLAEELVHLALKVAPDGYVPSFVEVAIDAYHRRGHFEKVRATQQLGSGSK